MRAGALGVLWAPVAVLIPAALEPGAAVGVRDDRARLPGARRAQRPAAAVAPRAARARRSWPSLALTLDALAGTQLLMRSLLGPNPILGARFYGIGNELKSGLAVLVLGGRRRCAVPRRARPPGGSGDGRRRGSCWP